MNTPKEILITTRKLLLTNEWTQGVNARNKNGYPVTTFSFEAVSYCISGATIVASQGWSSDNLEKALKCLRKNLPEDITSLITYNDQIARNKEDILALIDRAIASLD